MVCTMHWIGTMVSEINSDSEIVVLETFMNPRCHFSGFPLNLFFLPCCVIFQGF